METKILNLRLPVALFREVDRLSKRYALSRSEVVRHALTFYLNVTERVGETVLPAVFDVTPARIGFTRVRGLAIARLPPNLTLVVCSSSAGGIGPKKADSVRVEGRVLGRFMARVGLMRVVSAGAHPVLVSVTLAAERKPLGDEVLEGVKSEVEILGLEGDDAVVLSTEENVRTIQTGLGVTVIGVARERELKIGRSIPGDIIMALGKPHVGESVLEGEVKGEIADLFDILTLMGKDFIHEIVPVGSRGVAAEAEVLASTVGCKVRFKKRGGFSLKRSAGPGTVLLYTVPESRLREAMRLTCKPQTVVGEIYR